MLGKKVPRKKTSNSFTINISIKAKPNWRQKLTGTEKQETMQETFTEQEEETHHRHRRAAALRPRDRRNPRFRTRPGGKNEEERLAGEEKERRKVQKRERKRTEYDYWGVVVRSVELCGTVRVKSTGGKRRRREGRGLCGLRRRGWGWSADAIGTGCRGARALARSSLFLSVRPSLPLAEGVKDDRPLHSDPTGNATVPRERREGRELSHLGELACAVRDRTDD